MPCYLLEMQPSLAMTPNLANALQEGVNVTFDMFNPTRMIDELVLEKRYYEILEAEVQSMEPPGLSYTQALQRDVSCPLLPHDYALSTLIASVVWLTIQSRPELTLIFPSQLHEWVAFTRTRRLAFLNKS